MSEIEITSTTAVRWVWGGIMCGGGGAAVMNTSGDECFIVISQRLVFCHPIKP